MPFFTRDRYFYGFCAAAAILVGIGVAVVLAANRFKADSARVAHTYDMIAQVRHVRALVFDGIAAQRNFLLTGDETYSREYAAAQPQLDRQLEDLRLELDDAEQQRSLRDLSATVRERLQVADVTLTVFRTKGLAAAQQNIRANSGKHLSENIQAISQNMVDAEYRLLARYTRASERSAWLLYGLAALGIPLSLVILGTIYLLLGREVRDRHRTAREVDQANQKLAASVAGLERAGEDLRLLARGGSLLQSSISLPEALGVARRTLSTLFPEAAGSIYVVRESRTHAEAEITWGAAIAGSDPVFHPDECWALRRGQPYLNGNLATGMACGHVHASDLAQQDAAASASLCVPLTAQGISVGMLFLAGASEALLPRMSIVSAVAEQLSLALGNLRLQETLRQQSIRDPLTGLFNRRYLEESLPRELARSQRREQPLTLMMLDLDHFKSLNDRHGHAGGDAVLAMFGELLRSSCRQEDIPCRYGGEEFTLILPEMGREDARLRAEEIRAATTRLDIHGATGRIGPVSVSIGMAVFPAHASSPELLKQRADEALYRAKRDGRDRVEVAHDG